MRKNSEVSKHHLLSLAFCLFSLGTYAQQVVIGSSTMISAFSPIIRSYDYCVYEVIYLASEINSTGTISKVAFNRVDGTEVNPIDSVTIYMMHTSQSTLANGTFSLSGYTPVYSGTFPNDQGPGWREVTLTNPFQYNGTDNLQVIAVKGYEPAVGNTPVSPRWYYFSATSARARRYYGAVAISSSTMLTATTVTSDIRLDFSPVGIEELKSQEAAMFYNALSGSLTLYLPPYLSKVKAQLEIINVEGKSIWKEYVNSSREIFLNRIPGGMYFYRISSEKIPNEQTGKFIVQ